MIKHRSNGPATMTPDGHYLWFLNNVKHRYYGPGSTWTNFWYLHGKWIK